ncbi:MAG: hypothetical protein LBT83_04495 [Tannerella sp.]|nr:hypothetical protein [Tannerella sp.]
MVLKLFIPCMVAVLTAVPFLRFCCYPASFASVAVVYGTCRIYPRFLVETGYHLKNTAGSYTAKTRGKPVAENGILLPAPCMKAGAGKNKMSLQRSFQKVLANYFLSLHF